MPDSSNSVSLPIEFQFRTFGETELMDMLAQANRFMSDAVSNRCHRWLSMLGTSGTGKTYLMRQMLAAWRWRHGLTSWAWVDWPRIVGQAMARDRDMAGTIVSLSDTHLVFLDEIGADRDKSGWVADSLARLLSARVGKPTVITSNCTLEQLGAIDARIASRLIRDENILVQLENTPDFAVRLKSEIKRLNQEKAAIK